MISHSPAVLNKCDVTLNHDDVTDSQYIDDVTIKCIRFYKGLHKDSKKVEIAFIIMCSSSPKINHIRQLKWHDSHLSFDKHI